MTIEQIEIEMLALPVNERVRLAEMLLASVDLDDTITQAWIDEIDHRYQECLHGNMESLPAEQVMAEAYASISVNVRQKAAKANIPLTVGGTSLDRHSPVPDHCQ